MTRETPTESVETTRSKRSAGRAKGIKLFLRDILFILVAALVISFLIKTFLIRSFYIPSASMMDTLQENDRIIVSLLTPQPIGIERGDIVVFEDPGGWLNSLQSPERTGFEAGVENVLAFVGLAAPDSEDHLIKRVIGLPGDEVICCDEFGQLSVNGVALDETYIRLPEGISKATEEDFTITVPKDSLWVMGDNRYNSSDSSYHHAKDPGHEYVPVEKVVGRAILVSWPFDRFTWLDNHPDVFEGTEPTKK